MGDGQKCIPEKRSVGASHFFLSTCRGLHAGGRRQPSPQSSRVFLSNCPVKALPVFRMEHSCRHHALVLPFAALQLHRAARLYGHAIGNRQLFVSVPGPRACLTPLHGSRSESCTGACHFSSGEGRFLFCSTMAAEKQEKQ